MTIKISLTDETINKLAVALKENELDEDCISRKEAIRAFEFWKRQMTPKESLFIVFLNRVIGELKKLPSKGCVKK